MWIGDHVVSLYIAIVLCIRHLPDDGKVRRARLVKMKPYRYRHAGEDTQLDTCGQRHQYGERNSREVG